MDSFTYPLPPVNATDEIIRPSLKFRKEVRKVIFSLVGFTALYFFLFLTSLFLAFCLGVVAWLIVNALQHWMAIVFSLGLVIAGLMTTFFVIKFLFTRKKTDRSEFVEITAAEYPDLFAFIRRISEETNTRFPKHIYLSPDVNASVFYDSNFWSMFFPVRKNLVIGLGLVNMVNMSEFKSVIAHEFGHFSQKSMRAGSFVYHANKVIYNLLFENDAYAAALENWGRSHYLFALSAKLTEVLVTAMQSILKEAYKVVNMQYLKLSREMEFHADAMSVKAAGANNAIQALRRIEFADACYNSVLTQYNESVANGLKGSNIYSQQRIVASVCGTDLGFQFSNHLPVLNDPDKHYKNYQRLSIADQWASHPTRQDREVAMQAFGIEGTVVNESPWKLFGDSGALQKQTTESMYHTVQFERVPTELNDALFTERYKVASDKYRFPEFYSGYYDNRAISSFDPDVVPQETVFIDNISTFFKSHADLHQRIAAARMDIQLLEQIQKAPDGIRSFDFDGNKYKISRCAEVKSELGASLEQMEQEIKTYDEAVYRYYLSGAEVDSAATERLKASYRTHFDLREFETRYMAAINRMIELVEPFYQNQTTERAKEMNEELIAACKHFGVEQKEAKTLLADGRLSAESGSSVSGTDYDTEHWYFLTGNNHFDGEKLQRLIHYVNSFTNWIYESSFKGQKQLLVTQLNFETAFDRKDLPFHAIT